MSTKIQTFGVEVEFPMFRNKSFVQWTDKCASLAESGKLPGKLYEDATPCAEYATSVCSTYDGMMSELFDAFKEISSANSDCELAFIGTLPKVSSSFGGHIHIGASKGWSDQTIKKYRDAFQGAQSFFSLISQNAKRGSRYDGRRGHRSNYYEFYEPAASLPTERTGNSFTWNSHRTLENRIPPSSDFYHLLTLVAVQVAWGKTFYGSKTFDISQNFEVATQKGPTGKYLIVNNGELQEVDYSTFIIWNLQRIRKSLDKELKSMKREHRTEVERYLALFEKTTLSEAYSASVMTVRNLLDRSKMLIFDQKSYIQDMKIWDYVEGKPLNTKAVKKLLDEINSSQESVEAKRFRNFIAAVKKKNPKLAVPEDREQVQLIINKTNMEEFV